MQGSQYTKTNVIQKAKIMDPKKRETKESKTKKTKEPNNKKPKTIKA